MSGPDAGPDIGRPGAEIEPEGPPPGPCPYGPLVRADATLPDPLIWSARAGPDAPLLSVGEVAILSGPGGLGKSTVTLEVAVAASKAAYDARDAAHRLGGSGPMRGVLHGEACGLAVAPVRALIASYEDSRARLRGRMDWSAPEGDAWDAADERIAGVLACERPEPLWTYAPGGDYGSGPYWGQYWDAVKESGARLLILDPATVAFAGVPPGDGAAVRAFIADLTDAAREHGAGVLLVAHDTKAARTEARAGLNPGAGAVAGSAAWHDGARGVLYMRRGIDDDALIQCLKSNYGPTGWGASLTVRRGPVRPDGSPGPWRGYEAAELLTREGVESVIEEIEFEAAARKDERKKAWSKKYEARKRAREAGAHGPVPADVV